MIRFLKILFLCSLVCITGLRAQGTTESFAESSVLAFGKWFKMGVTSDGVYRINYSRLVALGLDDPSDPVIYCNNRGQLSYYNNDPGADDLAEVAIHLEKGNDGTFNEGDYLLFYAQGTHKWIYDEESGNYDFLRHNYSDTAWYFITSGNGRGKRIGPARMPDQPVNHSSNVSDVLFIHEYESENIIRSGREWYQPVGINGTVTFNPSFNNLVPGEEIRHTIRVLARASVQTIFRLREGETVHDALTLPSVTLSSSTGTYAQIATISGSHIPSSSSPVYEMKYFNNGEAGARAWVDYVRLHARRTNIYTGGQMNILDSRSVAPGRTTEFSIANTAQDVVIWDVTAPEKPEIVASSAFGSGGNVKFISGTESLKRFCAFTAAGAPSPAVITGMINNQDLHASGPADMIIVTHPLFREYADRLSAIHLSNSKLVSQVVTPSEIYNEFSGGITDLVAIRNFVRMKYLKQQETTRPLKYLLLFGDGSFENRTPPPDNPSFIPTWQTKNSNVYISSYTSDDFFGLLGDDEGEDYGTEDIGIGRLPVSDTVQAGIMVSKIDRYLNDPDMGSWKNVICLVADDEDGNIHMLDAEGLAKLIEEKSPSVNTDKIFLDAYPQVTTVNGQSYPAVNKAISDRVNSGCLILNYTGHGNEIGLAHERVVKPEDILSWQNGPRLPLFITATCEFSRFDNTDYNFVTGIRSGRNSAGETLLLRKDGGAIALMSTTRLAYSAPNYILNRNIYDAALEPDPEGRARRLGDIIRIAKNNSGSGTNKRNFMLLGDPALRLAFPWKGQVVTDSINGIAVTSATDTLKALSLITVSGRIESSPGQTAGSFNGTLATIVFDKEARMKTLANDGGPVMEFRKRNNILFSGKTRIVNGRFRFTFRVPREIDYSYGYGKISYYAFNEDTDMNGSFGNIIVGGFSGQTLADTTGPVIKLYFNDTLFRDGGITDASPRLLAIIEDEAGINTSGAGIGHDLTAYLDGDRNSSINLNSYYENDFESYSRGRIEYPFTELEDGAHTVTLKAWDNYNNSSEETITFIVKTDAGFILRNLINYPNPFMNETHITAGHNRPGEGISVTITIYNMAGGVIRILNEKLPTNGYQLPPVAWDGNDNSGNRAGKGLYLYKVTATTGKGETADISGRLIIL
jgi:hypothetical protein